MPNLEIIFSPFFLILRRDKEYLATLDLEKVQADYQHYQEQMEESEAESVIILTKVFSFFSFSNRNLDCNNCQKNSTPVASESPANEGPANENTGNESGEVIQDVDLPPAVAVRNLTESVF